MSLRIQCPACQALLQIGDECRGKQVRCARCNGVMLIPGTSLPAQVPVKNPSPPPPAAPKPPPLPVHNAVTAAKPPAPPPLLQGVTAEKGGARKASPPKLPPSLPPAPDKAATKEDRPAAAALTRPASRPWIPPAVRPWLPAGAFGALLLLAAITDAVDALVSPPESTPVVAQTTDVKTSNYPPKIDDNPRNVPPPPKMVEVPAGPVPEVITQETNERVKKATAYLRVTMPSGLVMQGSGFFAAEPGLVFTNAHVLGMMSAASQLPTKVDVVVNSGEGPEEFTLTGQVLGVDRISDLGVLRVNAEAGRLPAPLPVDSATKFFETQTVYIFGFPLGIQLGKNITVSKSSVSSLRRDSTGVLSQVQVNGGMHHGNSGGPVTNASGVVVGVAVSGYEGTQINFAVPADKVLGLLRGRVTAVEFDEPYRDNAGVRLPVNVQCMDPLQRIRNLRAEVWTGKPGPARSAPDPKPGDGARMVVPLTYDGTKAVGEIVLPAVAATEVVWVQPALTDGGGTIYWARAAAFTPSENPPLERKTVVLQQQFDSQPERTLKLTAAVKIKLTGGLQLVASKNAKVEALEVSQTEPRGGKCNLTIGSCALTREINGQSSPVNGQTQELLRGKYFGFVVSPQGALVQRSNPTLPFTNPSAARADFDEVVGVIANSYELTCLSVPNRQVKPGESWEIRMPLFLMTGGNRQVVDVHTTCTFEGSRWHQGQDQALIRLSGHVRGRGAGNAMGGKVTGKVHFGIAKGYLIQAVVKVESEGSGGNGEGTFSQALEVNLSRVPGNALGLTPAKPGPPPVQVTRGKAVLQKTSVLNNGDRQDYPNKAGCYYKVFPVELRAGKTYIIEMNRLGAGGPPTPTSLDPYLILHDPAGKKVGEDDDSGGNLNALIVYQVPTSGTYQIHATTFLPGLVGMFQLTVSEGITRAAPRSP